MNLIHFKALFSNEAVTAVCWTLFHSIWQGVLFAAVAGIVLMTTKHSRPVTRYNLLSALFFLLICTIVFTYLYERGSFWQLESGDIGPHGTVGSSPGFLPPYTSVHSNEVFSFTQVIARFLSQNAWLIVSAWFLVFTVKSVKAAFTLFYTRRLKTRRANVPAPYWCERITTLCVKLRITRTVTLLESGIIKIPVVFGHLKPVIFVPLGLLTTLPAEQIEAILVHELAHIKRGDYIVNLLQTMMEILFFFNPALLWVSSLIREEREHCCDDIAIEQTNDKKQYIKALISFKQLSMYAVSNYVPAFPGSKNSVLNRAARIVHSENKSLNSVEKAVLLSCLVFLFAFTIMPKAAIAVKHGAIYLKNGISLMLPVIDEKPKAGSGKKNNQLNKKSSLHTADTSKQKIGALLTDLQTPSSQDEIKYRDSVTNIALKISAKGLSVLRTPGGHAEIKYRDSIASVALKIYPKRLSAKQQDSILNMVAARANSVVKARQRDSLLYAALAGPSRKNAESAVKVLAESAAKGIKEQMRSVMTDLVDAHVINDKNSLGSFALTGDALIVNGVKQPDELHQKLKEKHLKNPGAGLFYGPVPTGMQGLPGSFYSGDL